MVNGQNLGADAIELAQEDNNCAPHNLQTDSSAARLSSTKCSQVWALLLHADRGPDRPSWSSDHYNTCSCTTTTNADLILVCACRSQLAFGIFSPRIRQDVERESTLQLLTYLADLAPLVPLPL